MGVVTEGAEPDSERGAREDDLGGQEIWLIEDMDNLRECGEFGNSVGGGMAFASLGLGGGGGRCILGDSEGL